MTDTLVNPLITEEPTREAMALRETRLHERIAVLDSQAIQYRDRIDTLTGMVDRAQADLSRSRTQHATDVALIGEALMSEASARSWCSEYDEVVDALNGRLTISLPTRTQDYTVEVQVTLTLSVTATDEEDAVEEASSLLRDSRIEYDIDQHLGIVSSFPSTYEWNVEEA